MSTQAMKIKQNKSRLYLLMIPLQRSWRAVSTQSHNSAKRVVIKALVQYLSIRQLYEVWHQGSRLYNKHSFLVYRLCIVSYKRGSTDAKFSINSNDATKKNVAINDHQGRFKVRALFTQKRWLSSTEENNTLTRSVVQLIAPLKKNMKT